MPTFNLIGDCEKPYEWDPKIVPVQILKLGDVFILSAPSEFTTMAGRRLRKAVQDIIDGSNLLPEGHKAKVTISGLTNTYSSYVTTYEEYQAQRYEAASTIFGPHTLEGYIQEFSRLARDMVAGRPSEPGTPPPDLSDVMIQLMPEPKFDRCPVGTRFGDVVEGKDVKDTYKINDTASVTFHAANPRNNPRVQGSYLTVEKVVTSRFYKTVAYDGDWSTKFDWRAGPDDPLDLGFSKQSIATLSWDIPQGTAPGKYRICYHGDHKVSKTSRIVPFVGCSSIFEVVASN